MKLKSLLLRIYADRVYGYENHHVKKLSRDDRIKAYGLGKLPLETSRFCLVRLDERDNLFMTGGSAHPPPTWLSGAVIQKIVFLYR